MKAPKKFRVKRRTQGGKLVCNKTKRKVVKYEHKGRVRRKVIRGESEFYVDGPPYNDEEMA